MSRGGGGGGVGVKKHISPSKTSVYLSTWYTGGNPVKNTHNPQRYQSTLLIDRLMGYSLTETQTTVRRSMGRQVERGKEGEGSTEDTKTIEKMYLVGLKRHLSIILLLNIE
jgi:hypothetical protein